MPNYHQNRSKASLFHGLKWAQAPPNLAALTPVLSTVGGGGQKALHHPKSFCRFRRARARLTKIHDFVPFNTWHVLEKPFLEFYFENFGKLNVKNFRGSSSIRWKIKKLKKNPFFFKKSNFFWLNLYCTCSQLSFEVYNTSVAQNLKFRLFLTWKNWFLTIVIWQLVAAEVYYIDGCFWCL